MDGAPFFHENQKDVELAPCQDNGNTIDGGQPGPLMQGQPTVLEVEVLGRRLNDWRTGRAVPIFRPIGYVTLTLVIPSIARPAEHRLDTRPELPRAERFGDVVVGSGLKTQQGVGLVGTPADDDHVGIAEGPDPPGGLKAIKIRQADVKGHNDGLVLVDQFKARGAGPRLVNGEACLPEESGQGSPHVLVIFDHYRYTAFHNCFLLHRDLWRPL